MKSHRYGAWVLAAALSGCLVSEEPLISDANSVRPLEDGTYRFTNVRDDEEEDVVLNHSGGVTVMTNLDDRSTSEIRMAKVQRGYFVMVNREDDDGYLYWLMRVDRSRATVYKPDDNCSRLRKLWFVDGKTPADFGIEVEGEGTVVPSCKFTRYKDLARAFRELIADGHLEPIAVIEPR